MSDNKREVEARGQDVESAIQAGLEKLGVGRTDVIVEVVDEGSRGLLGIGSRDAVVRLVSLAAPEVKQVKPARPAPERAAQVATPKAKETGASRDRDVAQSAEAVEADVQVGEVAVDVIGQLLEKMHINAEVRAHLSDPDDLTGNQIYIVTIEGNDLGLLIGPRGETLNAIQQVSRLMVGHQLRRRVDFVVDIQGYRMRKEQALARLAERMAKKVYSRKRPVSLEPMPPHERRVIHMTLRDDKEVYTQSTGEGRRRRVRILPKKQG